MKQFPQVEEFKKQFEPVSDATGQIVWHIFLLDDATIELSKYEMHNRNTYVGTGDVDITTQIQAPITQRVHDLEQHQ